MPYSDPEARKRVQREAQARRRAASRAAVAANGLTSTPVTPVPPLDATPILPPLAPPSAAEIEYAARLLHVTPLRGDTPEKVHMRVKTAWRRLLMVVEE